MVNLDAVDFGEHCSEEVMFPLMLSVDVFLLAFLGNLFYPARSLNISIRDSQPHSNLTTIKSTQESLRRCGWAEDVMHVCNKTEALPFTFSFSGCGFCVRVTRNFLSPLARSWNDSRTAIRLRSLYVAAVMHEIQSSHSQGVGL